MQLLVLEVFSRQEQPSFIMLPDLFVSLTRESISVNYVFQFASVA